VTAWSADWSYAYLRALMQRIGARYRFARLEHAPAELAANAKVAFVRHDVDMCLERACALAKLEAEWGVVATYHVMSSSPFYDLGSPSSRAALDTIRAHGHEIGMHYHPPVDGELDPEHAVLDRACARFEQVTGIDVRSVSFHMPASTMIGGPLLVSGRVNAYAAPLLAWYLSDSQGRWREGEPAVSIERPRADHLQILVHPLWWGEHNEVPVQRLGRLVEKLARERNESYEAVADLAYAHILVRPPNVAS